MYIRVYTFLLIFCLFGFFAESQTPKKKICITMDDLPAATTDGSQSRWQFITSGVLRAFRDYKVPAIGFVNEGKLSINNVVSPERQVLLNQWLDVGFELGNHTWSHIDYNTHT